MQKNILLFLIVGFQISVQATEIDSNNLKELLQSKNVKIESSKLELDAAQEREVSIARSFLPSIELHGSQESFKVGKLEQKNEPAYGAEAKINLFNGGRDQIHSEIRSLQAQKKNYQLLRVQAEELEKARNLYWQILYAREKIELLNAGIATNNENLKAAERRIRGGVATESDRFEFEIKNTELTQELNEIKLQQNSNISTLALMLGFDDPKELSFNEKLEHEHDIASFLKHSIKDHEFLYKENELQASESSLEATSQSRTWWPKVDAFASYNQYNERDKEFANASDRTESAVGLKATLSLANALDSASESRAFRQQAISSQKLAEMQKQEIEIHIENEMAELELLHSQVHQAEENITRAEKYYKLSLSEYARGVKNSPDILGASEKLLNMKDKKISIIRDFQLAKVHILSKMGK
jgi:outer membrane protein